jgi:hypothetical protein
MLEILGEDKYNEAFSFSFIVTSPKMMIFNAIKLSLKLKLRVTSLMYLRFLKPS